MSQSIEDGLVERQEGVCERCQRPYRVWSAASPLWNKTVRGGCIDGNEEYQFLCLNCFAELAEDRGLASMFRLTAERTANLQLTTPSGRVWDDTQFRWVEAQSDTITRLKEALENINRRASPRPDRTLGGCADELMWIADEARAALRSSLGGIRDHA